MLYQRFTSITLLGFSTFILPSLAITVFMEPILYEGEGEDQTYTQGYLNYNQIWRSIDTKSYKELILDNTLEVNPLPVQYFGPDNYLCSAFTCGIYTSDDIKELYGPSIQVTATVTCAVGEINCASVSTSTTAVNQIWNDSTSTGVDINSFSSEKPLNSFSSSSATSSIKGVPGESVCLLAIPVYLTGTFACTINGIVNDISGIPTSYFYCDSIEPSNLVTAPKSPPSDAFIYKTGTVSEGECR